MTRNLHRFYGQGHAHYITCSCFHRRPFLAQTESYPVFLQYLETIRLRYRFHIAGYVVMPEHFHLLMSEPPTATPSDVMFSLKQIFARRMLRQRPELPNFWQKRFYDFNIFTGNKLVEKIRYMHNNPVVRGLCATPEDWPWSSYRYYRYGEAGAVKIELDEVVRGEAVSPEIESAFVP